MVPVDTRTRLDAGTAAVEFVPEGLPLSPVDTRTRLDAGTVRAESAARMALGA